MKKYINKGKYYIGMVMMVVVMSTAIIACDKDIIGEEVNDGKIKIVRFNDTDLRTLEFELSEVVAPNNLGIELVKIESRPIVHEETRKVVGYLIIPTFNSIALGTFTSEQITAEKKIVLEAALSSIRVKNIELLIPGKSSLKNGDIVFDRRLQGEEQERTLLIAFQVDKNIKKATVTRFAERELVITPDDGNVKNNKVYSIYLSETSLVVAIPTNFRVTNVDFTGINNKARDFAPTHETRYDTIEEAKESPLLEPRVPATLSSRGKITLTWNYAAVDKIDRFEISMKKTQVGSTVQGAEQILAFKQAEDGVFEKLVTNITSTSRSVDVEDIEVDASYEFFIRAIGKNNSNAATTDDKILLTPGQINEITVRNILDNFGQRQRELTIRAQGDFRYIEIQISVFAQNEYHPYLLHGVIDIYGMPRDDVTITRAGANITITTTTDGVVGMSPGVYRARLINNPSNDFQAYLSGIAGPWRRSAFVERSN